MFKRCLTSLCTLLLIGSITASAAAQSGAVRPGNKTAVIKTVADTENTETPVAAGTETGQTPDAARAGNQLSETATIVIAVAIITAITIISVRNRRERICGPLSGCPLF
jgi:hypothetical protein